MASPARPPTRKTAAANIFAPKAIVAPKVNDVGASVAAGARKLTGTTDSVRGKKHAATAAPKAKPSASPPAAPKAKSSAAAAAAPKAKPSAATADARRAKVIATAPAAPKFVPAIAAAAKATKPMSCGVVQTHVITTTPPGALHESGPSSAQVVSKKRKEVPSGTGGGGEMYDANAVRVLVNCMKEVGYGSKVGLHKNLKAVFSAAVYLAAENHGIIRTADGWIKKFKRIRTAYSDFVAKIKKSGRDGDDEDLYDKPEFFDIIHELEYDRARHHPPAVMSTADLGGGDGQDGVKMTSTKKRKKQEKALSLEDFAERSDRQFEALISEVRASNAQRARSNDLFEMLINKL